MPDRPAFGRRVSIPPPARRATPAEISQSRPMPAATAPAFAPSPASRCEPDPVDRDIAEWKAQRGSRFRMPWSQLSLMASLCFGLASFVLPDSVNGEVDWLLWGLSAAAFYAWYGQRRARKRAQADAQEIGAALQR